MKRLLSSPLLTSLLSLTSLVPAVTRAQFAWQQDYAKRSPSGGIEWAPREFEFETGKAVRYIDYENGDDAADGSRETPWKHHPWDGAAKGRAAAAKGIDTFVFKGGD